MLFWVLALILFSPYSDAQTEPATLIIDLTLPSQNGPYHRPYVAQWIENDAGKSVRTLTLWREQAKWLKDLRSWWRKVGRKDRELVDAITSATRPAGHYHLEFKANGDDGLALPEGSYTLCIEVVREHGGRSMVKKTFYLNGEHQRIDIQSDLEVGQSTFTVEYEDK